MCVWPECMFVHYACAWCPHQTEGVMFPGAELQVMQHCVGAENLIQEELLLTTGLSHDASVGHLQKNWV